MQFNLFKSNLLTNHQIKQCSTLFNHHYGKWDINGPHPYQNIKLSPHKLKSDYLTNSYIIICTIHENIVGYAIYVLFDYDLRHVAWITQLIVHTDYRHQRIATQLIQHIIKEDIDICGIASCHPFALKAVLNATLCKINKKFITNHLMGILKASQVEYLINCQVDLNKCVVYSHYYVDHDEIRIWISEWMLGPLESGCEYIIIVENQNK
eukprot:NODE_375_length_8520_cov_0.377390.p6 type:complete len:209 gc:universal NODE_375_length_8520_cov_0.377390:5471-6097(+)